MTYNERKRTIAYHLYELRWNVATQVYDRHLCGTYTQKHLALGDADELSLPWVLTQEAIIVTSARRNAVMRAKDKGTDNG